MLNKVTIGADPELFAFNEQVKQFVSVHKCFPGTKKKPFKVPSGHLQLDGVAAELNIDPSSTFKDFNYNLFTVLAEARNYIPDNCRLIAAPMVGFHSGYWKQLPDNLKQLGCDPDFNVYTKTKNPVPSIPHPVRVGGGHIHIGWEQTEEVKEGGSALKEALIKQMDCIVGLRSISAWDLCSGRRKFYGSAGSYRDKPYGVEYRTPANTWVGNYQRHKDVFDWTMEAVERFNAQDYVFLKVDTKEVVKAINTCNRHLSRKLSNAIN